MIRLNMLARAVMALVLAACLPAIMAAMPASAGEEAPQTITQEYDWCTLTVPRTCTPGTEFEIRIDIKNPQETTRNWEMNKLAAHVFWDTKAKWGGYLTHFASAGVDKPGAIVMRGKFTLNDQQATAEFVRVSFVLSSSWTANDENTAEKLMGPRIVIIKAATPPAAVK